MKAELGRQIAVAAYVVAMAAVIVGVDFVRPATTQVTYKLHLKVT